MKVKEFIERKGFSEASGSSVLVDENLSIELNEFGIYEEKTLLSEDQYLNPLVKHVSPHLNDITDESQIANKLYGELDNIKYHEHIGYYKSLYVGHVIEGDFRAKASSGGMGTWIFNELFEKDLIDGVIHVKENTDKNSDVLYKYDISRTIEEIRGGSGTKYYPVEFSYVLKIVKEVPGRYAIIGIPSFIMAIRLLAEKDKLIDERIKFTIGLVCGHQKSSKFSEAFAWQVGIKPGNLKSINFRKKLPDRPANNYAVEMTGLIDDKEVTIVKPTRELLGQNWGQGYFKTKASDFTDDVMNETADMTIGDAWLPEYTEDSKGNNIIVIRNSIIDDLISEGAKSGRLLLDSVDVETIVRSQSGHFRHTQDELAYRLYKKDKNKEWRPKKRIEASDHIPFFRRLIQDMREDIYTQSHIVYKQAVDLGDLNYFTSKMGKLSKKYSYTYRLMRILDMGPWAAIKKAVNKITKPRN